MGDQKHTMPSGKNEELDLGQLLQFFKRGLESMFKTLLRIFLYLKMNAITLAVLLVLGILIGFLLKEFGDKKLKSEVIVKPNFESSDYLYDVVEELQSKILAKDTLFFKNLGIDVTGLKDFEIHVEPIEKNEKDKEKLKENNNYLEILQNYKDNDFVLEAVRAEVIKNAILTHRITFSHRNPKKGEEYVTKLLAYMNNNPYFNELKKVYTENAIIKIEKNKELIKQIDELIANYSKQLSAEENNQGREGFLLFDKEKGLDVPSLLTLKNGLLKEIEKKQIEAVEQRDAINIINLGKTQVVEKQFLNNSILLLPTILIGAFFLWSLLVYLNRKSKQLL
jgi:hypothetical protein